jgi:hypothetical protein
MPPEATHVRVKTMARLGIPPVFLWRLALAMALAPAARANDTQVTLGAGGLIPVKTSEVAMQSEILTVSTHGITVKYLFRNTSPHDVTATIGFPLPTLDGGDLVNEPMTLPRPDNENFVDFRTTSDGHAAPVRMETRAFLHGRDITQRLRSMGLAPTVLVQPLNRAIMALTPERRRRLEAAGLIMPQDYYPALPGVGEHGWAALWSMRVQFYWTQHFPAGTAVELEQTYSPVVGGGYVPFGDHGARIAKAYCANAAAARKIEAGAAAPTPAAARQGEIAWYERNIRYILTTANNWRGPIDSFRLEILTDNPDDVVLTCLPGVRRVDPRRYELKRSRFRPNRNLDLDILVRRGD